MSDEMGPNKRRTLEALNRMGVDLTPIGLPDLPIGAMSFILNAEAAAAFDELTRSGRDDLMVRQIRNARSCFVLTRSGIEIFARGR